MTARSGSGFDRSPWITPRGAGRSGGNRRLAWVVAVLTIAFALRVTGQVVQRWAPVSFLPAFDDWQGSGLPYPVLLAFQIAIVVLAVAVTLRMSRGSRLIGKRWIVPVLLAGIVYFTVMFARLILGFTALSDITWFNRPIPSAFHLVLAAQLMLIAAYQHHRD